MAKNNGPKLVSSTKLFKRKQSKGDIVIPLIWEKEEVCVYPTTEESLTLLQAHHVSVKSGKACATRLD